jgi:hypothetical protein
MSNAEKIIAAILVALAVLLIVVVIEDSNSPNLTLKKRDWTCTKQESHLRLIGKVVIPMSECVEYRKK